MICGDVVYDAAVYLYVALRDVLCLLYLLMYYEIYVLWYYMLILLL